MTGYERLQKALQTYFPSQTVEVNVILNKIYITCDKIFEAVLDTSRERSIMIDNIALTGFGGIYSDERAEIKDTSKYVTHSIVVSIMRSRKALGVKRIFCKMKCFRDYIKDMYPRYLETKDATKTTSIKIEPLMTHEAYQFAYFETIGHVGSIKSAIIQGVEFYPIWYIGKFASKFRYGDIVKDFNPYLQNLRQIMYVADNMFGEDDRKSIYGNILANMCLENSIIDKIISKAFDGKMTPLLFRHIKSLNKFDEYIAQKYGIDKLNIWDYIASMEGLPDYYIEEHYSQFKPYLKELFKNPDLSLEFIIHHKQQAWLTGSYPMILIFNKNIDRDFLVKHIRKHKNAMIHRLALLQSGDEYLFYKYRKHIKWDLLKEYFVGNESVSINQIIEYGKGYLSQEDKEILQNRYNCYIAKMFNTL